MKKKAYKPGLSLLLFLCGSLYSYAQGSYDKRIIQVFDNIRQAYSNPVQFRVKYVYANESKPGIILDSTEGFMELGAQGYYCLMDSTETIQTDSLAILLFHEDKIMYLSKKAASKGLSSNPIAMLDTLLKRVPGLNVAIAVTGRLMDVKLNFPPGLQYKQMAFTIDTTTYFVQRVTYIVKTEALMEDKNGNFDRSAYDAYAQIKAEFFDYEKGPANDAKLVAGNYLVKGKDGFETTEKYKGYKIFIASPNL